MSDEIRKHPNPFSQASIEAALEDLPANTTGAVVLYADADTERMRFGVVAKVGSYWTFAGNLEKDWTGPWSAHAECRYAW